jgi:hypothetical protein
MLEGTDVEENGSIVGEGEKWTVRKHEDWSQQTQLIVVLPVYLHWQIIQITTGMTSRKNAERGITKFTCVF